MYQQDYITLLAPKDRTPGIVTIYERIQQYVKKSGITVNFNGMIVTTHADFERHWLARIEREHGKPFAVQMAKIAKMIRESKFDPRLGVLNDIMGAEIKLPERFRFNQIKARQPTDAFQYQLWQRPFPGNLELM